MPKKSSVKIELIKKFLDPNLVNFKTLKSINSVIKLPVSSFKFISDEDEKVLNELLKISKIGELNKLEYERPFKKLSRSKPKKAKLLEIKKKDPEFEERIKKGITISSIIHRIKSQTISVKHKDQKIIVVGLNNAGKTAILSKFGGQLGIKHLASLKPTRGVKRQEIKAKDLNLHIWDFGGQKDHRDEYLQSPQTYFFGIDLLIYVIDVQDTQRYDESIQYFDKIIENIIKLEESPYTLVFIHKYDPDIRESNEVLLNVELLKDLIKSVLIGKTIEYEIYLSSIYSMISNEPQFSKLLKDVLSESTNIANPTTLKVAELGRIIESTLNAIVQLSSTIMSLEKRIKSLETPTGGRTSKTMPKDSLPTPEYSKLAPPPPPPSGLGKPQPLPSSFNARTAIMSELKQIFVKKGVTPRKF